MPGKAVLINAVDAVFLLYIAVGQVRSRIMCDLLYRSRESGYIQSSVRILHPHQPGCSKKPTAHNDWRISFLQGVVNLT